MTLKRLMVGYIGTNCYIVKNDEAGEGFIVDPGYDDPKIKQTVDELGMKPVAVLLTHGHFDHILGVERVREWFPDATVYIGQNDKELLETPSLNCSTSIMRRAFDTHADEFVEDGQVLWVAGIEVNVIFTPGHTQGGMCYYIPSEGVLFSGDTLFEGSVGRTDFPTGNMETLVESVASKLMPLPENTTVYPGHGDKTTIGREKASNPFLN